MKRIIVAILASVYLFSSAGASVHFHYCMDKLVSRTLLNNEADKCGKCGMKKDGNCCKDESQFIKTLSDQKTASEIYLLNIVDASSLFIPVEAFNELPANDHLKFPADPAPPGEAVTIYLRNCVFLI